MNTKTKIVEGGDDFGHLFLMVLEEKYFYFLDKLTWMFAKLVKLEEFDSMPTDAASTLERSKQLQIMSVRLRSSINTEEPCKAYGSEFYLQWMISTSDH